MKTYKIKKGWHYCLNFFPSIKLVKSVLNTSISHKIAFKNGYEKINELSCVNKLFGFTIGLFGVHTDSVRFGWTYDGDVHIYSYVYKNKKLCKKEIKTIKLGEIHQYTITTKLVEDGVLVSFYLDDYMVYSTIINYKGKLLSLELGPYFGGNTTAPNDIEIIFYE